jgi:hypothetical protein
MGVPLCYRRAATDGECDIVVSEWGKAGTDDDGECVQVQMRWMHGVTIRCQFEVWGRVIDSWVADLDADGKPEAIVVSRSFGSGVYGEVRVVTLAGAGLVAVPLPELSGAMAKGYMGHDEFHMEGTEKIVRTFPVYAKGDANCCPSGGVRVIVYTFKNKQLVPIETKSRE